MKALIIYDSYFGNTEKIAHAVSAGLSESAEVNTVKVGQLSPGHLAGIDLLVVGSPTRGFRPSDGIKKYLKGLPAGSLKGMRVAAFDTGFSPQKIKAINNILLTTLVKIFGYASKSMVKTLAGKGGTLACEPEGFFVKESEGPLEEGELERAEAWGRALAG
jgi:flavodoxin